MTRASAETQMARMREVLRHGPPLDAEELAEFESQRAREMAKAEARRQPVPQLQLPEAV